MQPLMDVVSGVKVTAQHSLVVLTNQLFDDFACAGVMVFIIANCGSIHTPDRAVDPVFSPSGLVRLNSWTGTHFGFETFKHWLRVLSNSMQEFHQFSQADLEAVQRPEHLLKLAQGQTHHGAQIGDHTGKSHPNTSLSEQ